MDFYEILDQVIDLLKQRGRVTYGALKLQFRLNAEQLEVLKEELIDAQRLAVDENSRILVWTGKAEETPKPTSHPDQTTQPDTHVAQPIAVASPPAASHVPEAERRQLTVMFCDLVDSTRLSSQLDPEDYREVVRAYQSACTEVIQRYDGHIAQYLGDGLLVYFGYPMAHEEDARRAVHAGLGIIQTIQALNTRLEQDKSIRLAVRLGIHTGLVVVGEIGGEGSHERLALGETPNVAARLQGVAESDTVVMSADTYRLIQGYFDCEPLGEHDLRGVPQPIAVYRVLRDSGAQSRLDVAAIRGLTPLVGRDAELQLLRDRWQQAKAGEGQVVLLHAEPGLGKSRMVQALREQLGDEAYTQWECRSSPYYQSTALYPIIDLMQRTFQWEQDETADEKLDKLEQALSQYRLPVEETVPLMAELLSLPFPADKYPPLRLTPQRQRQKTLETIVAMLLELAERKPVLLIVEDIHWTDPSTLELLDLLVEQTPTASLYALFTCRPEFQPQWVNRSYFTQVPLNRLVRDDIEQMATKITGEKPLPDEILRQLVEKTDGVPLFVEELTKAVVESGVLKETNGQYELIGSVASLAIPATLQDSLMARLDRLGPAKMVAQYASVIGRQFSYALLQTMSQLDAIMLQHELSRLVEAELLYQRGMPPQATYTFKHALIQDTAYASLLRSTRQAYHRRIAEVLTERFPETTGTQPEWLAHHYTEAGLNEQAIGYWHKAGKRAIQRSANVEAIHHLTQALELLKTQSDTRERAQQELALHLDLRAPLVATQGYVAPVVEQTNARARELCRQLGDTPELFPVLQGLWSFSFVHAQYVTALEVGERLLQMTQHVQDPTLRPVAHWSLGAALLCVGELEPARAHLEEMITFYDAQQHHALAFRYGTDPGVACLSWAALALWLCGYPDQALAQGHAALALAREVSHPFSLAFSLFFNAKLHQLRHEVQATHVLAEEGLTLATEGGFPFWMAYGTVWKGWALATQGQSQTGIAHMQRRRADFQATLFQTAYLALLAETYGNLGQTEEGLILVDEALVVVHESRERFYEAELYRLQGALLFAQQGATDNRKEAEACFLQALAIARRQQAKSWELRTATSLARLWQSQNKRQEAYDLLAPVYSWFTEGFDTADLQDAKALLNALEE